MKLAAKLLAMSDLTLFEPYYREHDTTGQKGVTLNGPILSGRFFMHLPHELTSKYELPITLDIYGPGDAGLHRVQRKIIKPVGGKNWRLNGKLVEEPSGERGRYSALAAGDIALLNFEGDPDPTSITMVLLTSQSASEQALRDSVQAALQLRRGPQSMQEVPPELLESLIRAAPARHPLRLFGADSQRAEDVVEAAAGDVEATRRLYRRGKSLAIRPVSATELADARRRNDDIGRAGEALVNMHLGKLEAAGTINGFRWDADENAASPQDFTIQMPAGEVLVDVKSTPSSFENDFHISTPELSAACGSDYRIYRVYRMDDQDGARLRASAPISSLAEKILRDLEKLPPGVRVASVQINPSLLTWDPEEILAPIDDEDED